MYIKDQLISILNLARTELSNHLIEVDPNKGEVPYWKLPAGLVHLTGWDEVLCKTLEAHSKGERFSPEDFPDIDEFNQQSLDSHQGISVKQAFADLEQQREKLITILGAMPDDKFEQPAIFPWGQVGTVEDILRGFAAHERRHAEEIAKIIV